MITKIANILSKVYTDLFPPAGGAIGAIIPIGRISYLPTWNVVIIAIILAAIGAITGLIIKWLWDWIFKKFKK